MANIKIDLTQKVGKIKPMHAVGQPPIEGLELSMFDNLHYLAEAGIPYSRLHDVAGSYASNIFVDIPNIFRDFDADVNDPASYDFVFTDALIEALVKAGIEPYYRLGVTIENNAMIKSYRLDPPKDPYKWACICEHIIAHYIDGWADGYHYDIKYWEIWNEPDDGLRVSQMWNGTKEQYYELYDVSAKHLKKVFGDRIKVGGYAAINFHAAVWPEKYTDTSIPYIRRRHYYVEFFHGFMEYIQKSDAPLDFFSWHSYSETEKAVQVAHWVREQLDSYGFTNTENHLNEWNPFHRERGTAHHSAEVTAMMLGMQKAPLDVLAFYDARMGGDAYGGFFNPYTFEPWHAYYSAVAFNHLYQLGDEVFSESDTKNLHVVAASNGIKTAILISNVTKNELELNIDGVDLSGARYSVIDQPRLLSWSPAVTKIAKNQVVLIEL
ncbi:MAG: hypothetical protein IKY33_02790 [Clostridia bacterium]|nr:hypothetical protein [Clostridia bacterium]